MAATSRLRARGASEPGGNPWSPGALAFVTSTFGTGDLKTWPEAGGDPGLLGGDTICQVLAANASPEPAIAFIRFLADPSNAKHWKDAGFEPASAP